jgi:tight adherence protein B
MDIIAGADRRLVIFALLAIIIVSAVLVGFAPYLGDDAGRKRAQYVVRRRSDQRISDKKTEAETARRRKEIAESIRVASEREGKVRFTLRQRLLQAGLFLSPGAFIACCSVVGLLFFLVVYFLTGEPGVSIMVAILPVALLPSQLISFLSKRRIQKFIMEFPAALEAIVRGARGGLPLNECFVLIAEESAEPLRGEFRYIVDAQSVGLTLSEAVERTAERIPCPEMIFFSLVLNVQQTTGGNIGEALSNLAKILRDRKKMRDKIKAISAEAVWSAGIIGVMPFLVGLGVYFSNKEYMMTLFETPIGNVILGGSLVWMAIGAFVMRKMIDFDI